MSNNNNNNNNNSASERKKNLKLKAFIKSAMSKYGKIQVSKAPTKERHQLSTQQKILMPKIYHAKKV